MEHDIADGVRLPAPVFRALGHALKGDPDLAAAQVRVPVPRAASFPPSFPGPSEPDAGASPSPRTDLASPDGFGSGCRGNPGSLIPSCSSRPGSVRSASRLSRPASWASLSSSRLSLSASASRRARFSAINATWPDSARPSVPGTSIPPSSRNSATAMSADTKTEDRVGTHRTCCCRRLLFPILDDSEWTGETRMSRGCFKDARIPRSCPYYARNFYGFIEKKPEVCIPGFR